MNNSQKFVQAFKDKFDSMSPEDRKKYLDSMGLKYRKANELALVDPTINRTFVVSRVARKRSAISGVDGVSIIKDGKAIPVCVSLSGKKLRCGSSKGKIQAKKSKGTGILGE